MGDVSKITLATRKQIARCSFISEVLFMYCLFGLPVLSSYSRRYDHTSSSFMRLGTSPTESVSQLAAVTFHRLLDAFPPEKLYLRGNTKAERERMVMLSPFEQVAWPAVFFEGLSSNTSQPMRIFSYQDLGLAVEIKLNPHNAKMIKQTLRPSLRPPRQGSITMATLVDGGMVPIPQSEFARKMAHFAKLQEIRARRQNNTGTYRDATLDELRSQAMV
ncbi:unnamed protein product [Amoebophrya sp. A120]|nr:unnamed protein product [Amoebophrya sp. A120]|eukprot:GSA120T00018221001.1